MEGRNFATESVLPPAWGYDAMDATHMKDIHRKFGELKKSKFPFVGPINLHFNYPHIFGMKKYSFLNYIPYNKHKAIKELEKDFEWKYYGGKHFESRWTKFFQTYYLPKKFGYDKRKAHLSSLILSGEITREEAIVELGKSPYNQDKIGEEIRFICKKLRIQEEELNSFINDSNCEFHQYKNSKELISKLLDLTAKINRRFKS